MLLAWTDSVLLLFSPLCLLPSTDLGWELLRQLLGLACVKAAKSPAGSLAQELAAGLLLPPGLPLHEEVLPPRWHQRGPEHRQVGRGRSACCAGAAAACPAWHQEWVLQAF